MKKTIKKTMKKTKIHYNQLGDTSLCISEVGFGTYRISSSSEDHQLALLQSIKEGINLIDTSSNYGDGDAEQLVGSIINQLMSSQEIEREDVVIVSKGGYIQGQAYIESQARKENNNPIPELVEYAKGLEHCIHPDFISDQITKSLNRLDLDYLDIYLLHNPEYYLMNQKMNNGPIAHTKEEFYRRIKAVFQHLESEVACGRIHYYGISSNTLPNNRDEYESVDLGQLIKIAEEISKNNHFKVVQFPLNLIENKSDILTIAKGCKMGVLINRPLNAILNQKLHRLVDFIAEDTASSLEIDDLTQELVQFELTMTDLNFDEMGLSEANCTHLKNSVSLGQQLKHHWHSFFGYEHWKETLSSYFLPNIEYTIQLLTERNRLSSTNEEWFNTYFDLFNIAIKSISSYYKGVSSNRSEQIKRILNHHIPDWRDIPTLSQKAIH